MPPAEPSSARSLFRSPPLWAAHLRGKKVAGRRLATLTAYDYPTARILDSCGLDFLLVGDSLGMVVLGHPDTTGVTMNDMCHHTRPVARGAEHTAVVSDMPVGSVGAEAVANAQLLRTAGADAVKIEGGLESLDAISAVIAEGIPVVGHLGMLPQRVREEGGYKIKGRKDSESAGLLKSARALDRAGVAAIVLELVHPPVAVEISNQVSCPTIGIGSGPGCDGEILVFHDLVGLSPWFRPPFAKPLEHLAERIQAAATSYAAGVRKLGKS